MCGLPWSDIAGAAIITGLLAVVVWMFWMPGDDGD